MLVLVAIVSLHKACGEQLWRLETRRTFSRRSRLAAKGWPVILLGNQLLCLVNSKMPCKWIIVVTTYHLGTDDFSDVWEASVLEHSLDVFPLFRKTPKSERFCFLIIILKFGEPQSYASDVGNVGTVSSYLALEGVPESVELGKNSRATYLDLVERRKLTRCKARYFGQQGLQTVQDFHVLGSKSLFLLSTPLRVSRQGVSSSICLALVVIDLEVITRKFLSPADLSGAQSLRVYESSEIVMVGKHEDSMLRAL